MAAPSWHALAMPTPGRDRSVVAPRAETVRWALACVLSVLPLAAMLHHAVFYPATCMLNEFGEEYSASVVGLWLSRDPSLWLALLIALAGFGLGNRFAALRPLALPFFVAFLPLSLWIWDVPFTGRVICHQLHDQQLLLAEGLPLRTRYLYYLGSGLFGLHLVWLGWHRLVALPAAVRGAAPEPRWEPSRVRTAL